MQSDEHHTLLRWSGSELSPVDGAPQSPLLAADSWLVQDGATRGRDAHWARFGGWARELGVAPGSLERFRIAVEDVMPRSGRWFPRLEVVEGGHVQLRLRPAQPIVSQVRVAVGPAGDPRVRPRWKGPDIPLLLELRAQAVAAEADELLLCDDEGRLVEGAFTALLWWEKETLCTTPQDRTLPSVTRALLLAIARERGVPVMVRSPLPEEIAAGETWLVNAAHGLQTVTAWDGKPAGPAPRAGIWRAALDARAR